MPIMMPGCDEETRAPCPYQPDLDRRMSLSSLNQMSSNVYGFDVDDPVRKVFEGRPVVFDSMLRALTKQKISAHSMERPQK